MNTKPTHQTESYLKLISGSDIRGYSNEYEGQPITLTCAVAENSSHAFALWLSEKLDKPVSQLRIAVGRDSRLSGESLLNASISGFSRAGVALVADCGLCTTPAMFMTTVTPVDEGGPCDGAVMITASHLPWYRNGLKFCTREGGLLGGEIKYILERAAALNEFDRRDGSAPFSKAIKINFLPIYEKQLSNIIKEECGDLHGLHIAVDAGNGAGGFYAHMLKKLGADITGSQFLEPDGRFPNHVPNPEDKAAMASVSKAVLQSGADIGIIFDTDCDRVAIVDERGREINRNRLIALMVAVIDKPGATYVTDSVTSSGLARFIEAHGAKHHRFKRGYRNVIDECRRLNDEGIYSPLAIETSGHAALSDHYYLDDGAYLVTLLLVKAMEMKKRGKTLASLIETLEEPAEAIEVRIPITAKDFTLAGQAVIDRILRKTEKDKAWKLAPDNHEGVRVSLDLDGKENAAWFLLRLSLHDPVLPFNAESDIIGGTNTLCGLVYGLIKDCEGIDPSKLIMEGDIIEH